MGLETGRPRIGTLRAIVRLPLATVLLGPTVVDALAWLRALVASALLSAGRTVFAWLLAGRVLDRLAIAFSAIMCFRAIAA